MSDPSVTERRIRPIQDAVATGNWKQALQLCDKWSKKGERSDRFLVGILISDSRPVSDNSMGVGLESVRPGQPPRERPA